MGEYLTESGLCQWLKISRSTANRWRREGMPFTKINKSVRFDIDTVQKWIDAKHTRAANEHND